MAQNIVGLLQEDMRREEGSASTSYQDVSYPVPPADTMDLDDYSLPQDFAPRSPSLAPFTDETRQPSEAPPPQRPTPLPRRAAPLTDRFDPPPLGTWQLTDTSTRRANRPRAYFGVNAAPSNKPLDTSLMIELGPIDEDSLWGQYLKLPDQAFWDSLPDRFAHVHGWEII